MHLLASQALFEDAVRTLSPELAQRRGWRFHSLDCPIIDCSFMASNRTQLRLRLLCDDWNDLPPSIVLQSPDGTLLRAITPNPTGVFHPGPHPITNLPFVCMRGSREYHTHSSHTSDAWGNVRQSSSYSLGGILTQVWNAWLKGKG
jgi:hypothetical protein